MTDPQLPWLEHLQPPQSAQLSSRETTVRVPGLAARNSFLELVIMVASRRLDALSSTRASLSRIFEPWRAFWRKVPRASGGPRVLSVESRPPAAQDPVCTPGRRPFPLGSLRDSAGADNPRFVKDVSAGSHRVGSTALGVGNAATESLPHASIVSWDKVAAQARQLP